MLRGAGRGEPNGPGNDGSVWSELEGGREMEGNGTPVGRLGVGWRISGRAGGMGPLPWLGQLGLWLRGC